jgi:5-(carboxyamino)imidazole ribonucleotide synthase
MIAPGAVLGVLGSGQLGRMFTIAARRMGYRVHTFSPDSDTPTGQVADVEVSASYDDAEALRAFAAKVAVVTFEFENVPSAATEVLASIVPVRPSPLALHVSQQRAREKRFLASHGIPTVPFEVATTAAELAAALERVGVPAIVKTAAFGYDGKGQQAAHAAGDGPRIWGALGGGELVVEKKISLQAELSVIAARGMDGYVAQYPLFENRHSNHILDVTTAPALVPPAVAAQATEIGRAVLEALNYVGLLCIEFFLSTDGELMVNELAPRPHNSGHLTFDAAVTRADAPGGDGQPARRSVGGRRARLGRRMRAPGREAASVWKSDAQTGPQDGSPDGHRALGARSTGSGGGCPGRAFALGCRRWRPDPSIPLVLFGSTPAPAG